MTPLPFAVTVLEALRFIGAVAVIAVICLLFPRGVRGGPSPWRKGPRPYRDRDRD